MQSAVDYIQLCIFCDISATSTKNSLLSIHFKRKASQAASPLLTPDDTPFHSHSPYKHMRFAARLAIKFNTSLLTWAKISAIGTCEESAEGPVG